MSLQSLYHYITHISAVGWSCLNRVCDQASVACNTNRARDRTTANRCREEEHEMLWAEFQCSLDTDDKVMQEWEWKMDQVHPSCKITYYVVTFILNSSECTG